MCKCNTKSLDFQKALLEAKARGTKRTKYGVYFEEFPTKNKSFPFVDKIKNIEANVKICCYYLSNGSKIEK